MTSLERKVNKYKNQMSPENFKCFCRMVSGSVNLQAKNTKNRSSKDVAEFEIETLAKLYLKKDEDLDEDGDWG
jgi:hypothetical protein